MSRELTNRQYLGVVLPFMISTSTQPLMGAVNTAVMGTLSDPAYISGVALGAVLFNTIYWLFGFLRVSTSGYSAQALGTGDIMDRATSLGRPAVVAMVVSTIILILQKPILAAYLHLVNPAPDVAALTAYYYDILIWGAPFTLLNYVFLGWLMGQARLRASLFMQMSTNILNVILCIFFVMGLGYDVGGVGTATLISQGYGCLVGLWLVIRYAGFSLREVPKDVLFSFSSFLNMMKTNGNLMIRTSCLQIVNNLFAAASTSFGTEILAANAVILQVQYILSYLLDGVGNGNSLFTGRAVGRRNRQLFEETKSTTLKWLAVIIFILFSLCFLGGDWFLGIFSNNEEVLNLARQYTRYLYLYPVAAGVGLAFYGMYTGATYTSPMRDMMIIAMICFAVSRYFLVPLMGNDGLWISYLLFYAAQSVINLLFFGRLRRHIGFYGKFEPKP
ncbi:MATE family efflux transporter [Deltaproteobacteria bacterium Smac51]|nr:MATE family efflux transporter [Deltaproteobacteria bacterium Smac51]